jgi:hypothetical protein
MEHRVRRVRQEEEGDVFAGQGMSALREQCAHLLVVVVLHGGKDVDGVADDDGDGDV